MDWRVESKICSFCGEQGSQENRLAGGLGAMICMRCLEHFYDVTRTPELMAGETRPVWDEMSDADLLSKLPLILRSAAQNADFAVDWVGLIRARGISWAQIGRVLGVSRQAAWERFASNLPPADPAADRQWCGPENASHVPRSWLRTPRVQHASRPKLMSRTA